MLKANATASASLICAGETRAARSAHVLHRHGVLERELAKHPQHRAQRLLDRRVIEIREDRRRPAEPFFRSRTELRR